MVLSFHCIVLNTDSIIVCSFHIISRGRDTVTIVYQFNNPCSSLSPSTLSVWSVDAMWTLQTVHRVNILFDINVLISFTFHIIQYISLFSSQNYK